MAATALLLAFIANFQHELVLVHLTMHTKVFGFALRLGQISTIVSLLIITILLLTRLCVRSGSRNSGKLEIAQAQHVQQILIPDKLPKIEGLAIESEYRLRARSVATSFRCCREKLREPPLIVVGDVTGKGLQAGMLVALIVGALRSAFQQSSDPVQILSSINDQLCERGHSSATCMVLRVERDGTVTLAHAGQSAALPEWEGEWS